MNRFLQDRGDNFYSKYLEELKTERFLKDDIITKPGFEPDSVYFIMTGIVLNNMTKRYFESGQMINHDVTYKKELVRDEYIAFTDVAVVKFDKQIFVQICDQFPDIEEDVKQMIHDHERIGGNSDYIAQTL